MEDGAGGQGVAGPLVCPACVTAHGAEERFCSTCGMPLVVVGDPGEAEAPRSEAHGRARKVRPELTRGELVRVAGGRNQAEAELIHGLLLEEGIPSLVRRAAAFDVPDFLAAGQRDVLVPASALAAARELLFEAELAGPTGSGPSGVGVHAPAARPSTALRVGAVVALGALVAALVAWVLLGFAA